MCDKCLKWDLEEKIKFSKRILKLSDSQIEQLFEKVQISYGVPMKEVVEEIRDDQEGSMNLDILLSEANSKENLLHWLSYFEKQSKT